MKTQKQPRGIRNNNPLNIRVGNNWKGERAQKTDKQFEEFVSMEWGIRAAFIILRRYINQYKRNTIAKIIAKWAPPKENATRKYIKTVSQLTDLDEDEPIRFENKGVMVSLFMAMAYVECGALVDLASIEKGYDMV